MVDSIQYQSPECTLLCSPHSGGRELQIHFHKNKKKKNNKHKTDKRGRLAEASGRNFGSLS